MDLQPIIPTSKFLDTVKILHIEPTNACQARCPQCPRETDLTFDKTNIHHLTLDQIEHAFSIDQIENLDKMFMCGNYGDPAAGRHTLEIFRYFRKINPKIVLGMNTNGGLRNPDWWTELANILNQPMDYVVWSIDGLENTNHIYRVNVDWSKVMENAQAFIQAGGNAHWDMLIFKHNEHQISAAENMAKDLGFKWFRGKVSKRFKKTPISFLRPPSNFQITTEIKGEITCMALKESSIYMSCQGDIYPCCWLGSSSTNKINQFENIQKTWLTDQPMETCFQTCAKTKNNNNSFTNQWQFEKEFICD